MAHKVEMEERDKKEAERIRQAELKEAERIRQTELKELKEAKQNEEKEAARKRAARFEDLFFETRPDLREKFDVPINEPNLSSQTSEFNEKANEPNVWTASDFKNTSTPSENVQGHRVRMFAQCNSNSTSTTSTTSTYSHLNGVDKNQSDSYIEMKPFQTSFEKK